ncbi:hypothetical protein [Neobacillus sp. OS1-2]|uniref:hypothetical protein n=1 Tax=Neobacillus sp. OS1-2 TaxID=3070680 RepID=UPI0035A5A92D
MAYLSTIKDASTNELLAYHVSDRITLDIATKTIHKLMNNKKISLHSEAFIHSDQGSHYPSPRYQKLLTEDVFLEGLLNIFSDIEGKNISRRTTEARRRYPAKKLEYEKVKETKQYLQDPNKKKGVGPVFLSSIRDFNHR